MRKLLSVWVAAAVLLGLVHHVRAADEARALVLKAIKAHGIKKGDSKKAMHIKTKGKLELMGGIEFTQEIRIQHPNKFKDVMDLEIKGMKITQTTVFDGKKAWVSAAGQTIELKDKYMDAVQDAMAMMKVLELTFLQDKKVKLELVGEMKVENRPAIGLRISSKGLKEINLYFDKKTGLVVKVERRTVDPMNGQEITEERIIQEYQKVDGRQQAKKVLINRDGKKFMEAEVTELKHLDKIDDSEFAKP